jgi:branched-chain amino acid transport system permease protein
MLIYGLAMMFMMIYRTQGLLPPRPRTYRLDGVGEGS